MTCHRILGCSLSEKRTTPANDKITSKNHHSYTGLQNYLFYFKKANKLFPTSSYNNTVVIN